MTLALIMVCSGCASWIPDAWKHRQVEGDLVVAPEVRTDAVYEVGAFRLTWRGEPDAQLTVTHRDSPDRVLWATLPGEAFVAGGRGDVSIEEARGSFFIEDDVREVFLPQSIELIEAAADAVQIAGRLGKTDGGDAPAYRLRFAPISEEELGFDLSVDDAQVNRAWLTYESDEDEDFFGFGEEFTHFNLKGHRVPIFVSEQGIGRGAQPITWGANLQAKAGGNAFTTYAPVPLYLTSRMRGFLLETYPYSIFDLRQDDRVQIKLFDSRMHGRILKGDSPAELIEVATRTTGRMRPLPDWILEGAVIGMQGGTEKVRDMLGKLEEQGTPVAAFWLQDWVGQRRTSFGKQLWWNWTLDPERYPGWDELVDDLRERDIRVMLYMNPFLADVAEREMEGGGYRNLYEEAIAQHLVVKRPDGAPYLILNTSFSAALLDLTNPRAREWAKRVIAEEMLAAGASGWMADFGEALPADAVLHSGEDAFALHNRYPELWAEVNREAVEVAPNSDELVFFMRAGYTHSPRHATLFWLGDQLVSWDEHDGIKSAVTGLLSGGVSGYAFNHSDIGGYTTITNPLRNYHRSRQLLTRWMELAAFHVVFRTHEGNIPEANVQFYTDETTMAAFDRMARLYAAWGFYRKELVREAAATGLPVARHLWIHYPDDAEVRGLTSEQFLIGSELLVAPVLDPLTDEKRLYLPAGRWVHLWSGRSYGEESRGDWVTVRAPGGAPPVFYPEGSEVGRQLEANARAAGLFEAIE